MPLPMNTTMVLFWTLLASVVIFSLIPLVSLPWVKAGERVLHLLECYRLVFIASMVMGTIGVLVVFPFFSDGGSKLSAAPHWRIRPQAGDILEDPEGWRDYLIHHRAALGNGFVAKACLRAYQIADENGPGATAESEARVANELFDILVPQPRPSGLSDADKARMKVIAPLADQQAVAVPAPKPDTPEIRMAALRQMAGGR